MYVNSASPNIHHCITWHTQLSGHIVEASGEGQVINIKTTLVSMASDECTRDYIDVYDGPSAVTDPLVVTFCGGTSKSNLYVVGEGMCMYGGYSLLCIPEC